mmetsp:Transcript_30699/g.44643  ORF Transcript_30699/g.44643 Transcript_30699/m.44643 type:complete len:257 (-) Transcript_30699:214-984(-)
MVRLFVVGKYVGEHPRETGGSADDVHELVVPVQEELAAEHGGGYGEGAEEDGGGERGVAHGQEGEVVGLHVQEGDAQPRPPWRVQRQPREAEQRVRRCCFFLAEDGAGCGVGERGIDVNFGLVVHDLPIHGRKALLVLVLLVAVVAVLGQAVPLLPELLLRRELQRSLVSEPGDAGPHQAAALQPHPERVQRQQQVHPRRLSRGRRQLALQMQRRRPRRRARHQERDALSEHHHLPVRHGRHRAFVHRHGHAAASR